MEFGRLSTSQPYVLVVHSGAALVNAQWERKGSSVASRKEEREVMSVPE